MTKSYRPYDPDQGFLLPVSLGEWLPADHLAYLLSDVVDALDLSAIEGCYEAEERGYPPYHPRMPEKAQRTFTDPDSPIMPGPGGKTFLQAYNAPAAVDSSCPVIVAAAVTTQLADQGEALPLVDAIRANTGRLLRELSADAGYFSARTVIGLRQRGLEPFIPPDKARHHAPRLPAPRGHMPQALSLPDRMRRELRTQRGRRHDALRRKTPRSGMGADQAGAPVPAVPPARLGEGPRGLDAPLHRPYSPHALRPLAAGRPTNPPGPRGAGLTGQPTHPREPGPPTTARGTRPTP